MAAVIFGLIQLRPNLSDDIDQLVLIINSPTPTITPTSTATATPTPTFTTTSTPTPTDTVTLTPTNTATATPTDTATPTPVPTNTPFGAPTATNTPTVTPTPTPRYGKPVLLGPADGKLFGQQEEVILRWENMGPLGPNEYYAVRLKWQQNGEPAFGGHNLKDNFWLVPPDLYWGLADEFTGREYDWFVFVEQITTDDNGQQVGRPVSNVSDTQSFLWQQ